MTFANMEDMSLRFSSGNIVEFFKSANFKTFWISNQYMYGDYDSAYSVIASMSDEVAFLNRNDWRGNKTRVHDGALLEVFKEKLKDPTPNKIFFIHLMGSHSPYGSRYPSEFQKFGNKSFINDIFNDTKAGNEQSYDAYDNSILYTDYILQSLIDDLKELKTPSYMLYFADHGEDAGSSNPDKFLGHNESISTKPMFEIPFILWLSAEYKNTYKQFSENLSTYLDRPYQTDDVIHTIIELSKLDHIHKNTNKSIVSDRFTVEQRTYGGKKYIK